MNMEKNEVIVSVICKTYNHELFIRDALQGFIAQETDFKYEVIVHDDCSTDGTAKVIEEYEKKYPNIIKPIYQKENTYSKKIDVQKLQILPKLKGKYIAFCEGDDFWTDPLKLKRQVEVIENNEDCSICFNRVALSDINGKENGATLPTCQCKIEPGKIESHKLMAFIVYPGPFQGMLLQLSGCMCKKDLWEKYLNDSPEYRYKFDVGDLPFFFYLASKGNGYYIKETMSVYRTENPNSWAGNISKSKDRVINHINSEIAGLKAIDEYLDGVIHEDILLGIRNREFHLLQLEHNIASMKAENMLELYMMLPFSAKCREYLFQRFPWTEPIWNKYRKSFVLRKLKDIVNNE